MAGTSPPARAEGSLWRCIPAPFLPGHRQARIPRAPRSTTGPCAEDRAKIEAVDPANRINRRPGGWYDGEIRETWPAFTTTRYLALGAAGSAIREERRTQSFASLQKISTATRLPSLAQKMTCRVERQCDVPHVRQVVRGVAGAHTTEEALGEVTLAWSVWFAVGQC